LAERFASRASRITNTQITARLDVFGLQGGGQISILPLITDLRGQPLRTVPDLIGNFSDLVITPASWYGGAASLNVAQAFSSVFSAQASFRLDLRRFTTSPYVLGVGRVDEHSTGWLPLFGFALGAAPTGFPLSFLAEYRFATQDDNEGTLGAVRIGDYKYRFIDQPGGWLGGTVKVDWPMLVNIRLDPFERTGMGQSLQQASWFTYQFWRFVFVQEEVAKFAETFIEFPPMQKPASFNLETIKEQIVRGMHAHPGA
jgi:hypothetical protein